MHFIIHAVDKSDMLPVRLHNYQAHKDYLNEIDAMGTLKIIMSGPLLADDETMVGSFFLLEAQSKQDAIDFHHNDPFFKAQIWAQSSVYPFLKRRG
jgi:uncharacterized protein